MLLKDFPPDKFPGFSALLKPTDIFVLCWAAKLEEWGLHNGPEPYEATVFTPQSLADKLEREAATAAHLANHYRTLYGNEQWYGYNMNRANAYSAVVTYLRSL